VNLIERLESLPAETRGGAVSIGNFDGVHRGHAVIARQLVTAARAVGGPAIVFTFDPHPAQLLRPHAMPAKLSTLERRAALLAELGVDSLVVCATTPEILQQRPDEFFRDIIVDRLGARAMVEGPNFLFGRGRSGNITTLAELCRGMRMTLDVVPPLEDHEQIVSSSRVRELLQLGDVDGANALLTRPYRLQGIVRGGAKRGSQIGFPTANLHEIATITPGAGVYAGAASVNGELHAAAINIGPNPTFGEQELKVEVHIPAWSGDLYDTTLAVDIVSRLRDIHPFASVAALVEQLRSDVAEARNRFDRALPTLISRSPHGA